MTERLSTMTYDVEHIFIYLSALCISSLVRSLFKVRVCALTKSLSSVQLFSTPWTCNPRGSSVHGISQGRILEWVVISYARGSSWPRDWTATLESPALAGKFFTIRATWEAPICSNSYWLNYLTLFTLCAGLILVVRYMWPYNNLMIKLLLFLFYSKKSP